MRPLYGTAGVAWRGSSGLPGYQVCSAACVETLQEQTITVAEGSSLLHQALSEMSATVHFSKLCKADCRSTFDFKPPFKIYTTIEDDRDAPNKVRLPVLGVP